MKIVVCIKQVPDTNEVKLDPVTGTLIRDGVPSIINPDDKAGLEAALAIKEQTGAHSRCIPFKQETLSDTCVVCGKKATKEVIWGRQY